MKRVSVNLVQAGIVLAEILAWRALAALSQASLRVSHRGSNYPAVYEDVGSNEHVDGMAVAAGTREVIAGERAPSPDTHRTDCRTRVPTQLKSPLLHQMYGEARFRWTTFHPHE